MDVRNLLEQVLPPVVSRIMGRAGVLAPRPVWEGVYGSLREVPGSGPGFDGDEWLRQCRVRLARLRAEQRAGEISPAQSGGAELLALLAATIRKPGPLRILDFGGGLGFSYVPLTEQWLGDRSLEYHIVETAAVGAEGRRAFAGDGRIVFHSELPAQPAAVDLVYISTALQYIEDYAGLLGRLCGYAPDHILLAKLGRCEGATFATAQKNVDGSVLPQWFFALDDIAGVLGGHGYQLVWRSGSDELPAHALPAGRLPRATSNLLFSRRAPVT